MFPLSLGSTNDCFQDDERPDSGERDDESSASEESESNDPVTTVPLGTPPPLKKAAGSSQAPSGSKGIEEGEEKEEGSTDSEKEVKSILTKDRRPVDDGYKSVWFKEDINSEAKDDVMLIEIDSDAKHDEHDRSSGTGGSDVVSGGTLSECGPDDRSLSTVL
uniref:Uncharacterized protein n=1 Tax=Sphaerodactylus townsendi TaxID=933632 RepID=A0ACB8G282_9SAUR